MFRPRVGSVVFVIVLCAGSAALWEWRGWDWRSFSGAAVFARTAVGLILAFQALLATAQVAALVAPTIAAERDRKSLDSLLATRLSAAELVLGAMLGGMSPFVTSFLTTIPLLLLPALLGNIDPRLLLPALAGIVSTAFALAALAIAVSARARTAARARTYTVSLAMAWMFLPFPLVMVLPRIWPAVGVWVTPPAVFVLDSSPLAVVLNFAGVIVRGPLIGAVLKMIALQWAAGGLLLLWAMLRLRPASRAVYDAEGRAANLRSLRTRWRRRPACGDDPVFWHEVHNTRGRSRAASLVDTSLNVLWVVLLAYVMTWFAAPAFVELFQLGYGARPGKPFVPEVSPFARVLVAKLSRSSMISTPGQARLEFNIILRQTSGLLDFLYVLLLIGAASESIAAERERDTWLGLIATPLPGREILKGKILGSIWRMRGVAFLMPALWSVGLLSGSLHPLGFLAAVVGLVVSSGFLAVAGVSVSLWSRDRAQAANRVLPPVMVVLGLGALPVIFPGILSVIAATFAPPFLAWAALLSYEDVRAVAGFGRFPAFDAVSMGTGIGAVTMLIVWLIGTLAQGIGAWFILRAAIRDFDAAVGRPVLPASARLVDVRAEGGKRKPGDRSRILGRNAEREPGIPMV